MGAAAGLRFGTGPFGRSQRNIRGSRIPVIVLTGFLGAGKTTLLNAFLQTKSGANTLVVVNEYGETPIDHFLLRRSADEVALLGNGCVCCTVRSDLEVALRRIAIDRSRGDMPRFERVIIETTGLADPGPVLATFLTDRALGDTYHVDAVVTVVDAVNALQTLTNAPEAAVQIALADRVIVSKTDLADSAQIASVRAAVAEINAGAEICEAHDGQADASFLQETQGLTRLRARIGRATDAASHGGDVQTFVVRHEQPMAWSTLSHFLRTICDLRGDGLLRLKGLAALRECPGPVVVQAVHHIVHKPVEMTEWPDEDHSSRFVFITRDIDESAIRGLFHAIVGLSGAQK